MKSEINFQIKDVNGKNLNYFFILSVSGIWAVVTTVELLCGEPRVLLGAGLSPWEGHWGTACSDLCCSLGMQ